MKQILIILFSLSTVVVFAQKADIVSLQKAVVELNTALINKDSAALKKLLNDKVTYGHSNGWIESKKDVIGDLYNGKLAYKTINASSQQIEMDANVASVRAETEVSLTMNDKPLQMKLHVLQVWVWKNKEWKLLSRQSVKI